MAGTAARPRRASGTRTSLDVLRHGFRPPTPEDKLADRTFVERGGQLLVMAVEALGPTRVAPARVRHGPLLVSRDRVTWTTRRHPDEVFLVGEWSLRPSPSDRDATATIATFVKKTDQSIVRRVKVPTPDVELLHWVMNEDHRGVE
jgi:hypothetical protein